ncbi:TorF family putative porin [Bordetella genomosp. 6]|uniref:TorF family putative porin n=1 Tax=Bordetella genomosp. 6 TaxID=463024 RepID=UPI000A28F907|nr:TorF family putative porin [Bordetella genomosp. 6]ARP76337.1 hypothetical protein CAL11_09350 [Bordetella genomosp. 6]
MKKPLFALPLVLAVCAAAGARAEPTDLGAGFSLSGNAAMVSDYRFRGYSQTDFRPAIQLGFDLNHTSGLYLGNWNSNVSDFVFTDGNLEMDFYGGWKGEVGGGVGLDVGVLHYYYPGSSSPKGGNYNNTDLYLGVSYANYSLKYSYTPGDFFSTPDTKGTWYLDGTATFDLGDGWGLVGHLGYQKLKKARDMDGDALGHYVDYKLGVTKDLSGWVLGLAAVGASRDNWLPTKNGHPSGRLGAVFSVARTF